MRELKRTGSDKSLKHKINHKCPSCLHLKMQQIMQVIYITATGNSKSIIRNINANIIFSEVAICYK